MKNQKKLVATGPNLVKRSEIVIFGKMGRGLDLIQRLPVRIRILAGSNSEMFQIVCSSIGLDKLKSQDFKLNSGALTKSFEKIDRCGKLSMNLVEKLCQPDLSFDSHKVPIGLVGQYIAHLPIIKQLDLGLKDAFSGFLEARKGYITKKVDQILKIGGFNNMENKEQISTSRVAPWLRALIPGRNLSKGEDCLNSSTQKIITARLRVLEMEIQLHAVHYFLELFTPEIFIEKDQEGCRVSIGMAPCLVAAGLDEIRYNRLDISHKLSGQSHCEWMMQHQEDLFPFSTGKSTYDLVEIVVTPGFGSETSIVSLAPFQFTPGGSVKFIE